MRSRQRKLRRLKPSLLNVARNMGRWKPQDDFLLIQSVVQLNSLEEVFELTKFSRDFSKQEIRERWYAVLYDIPISRMIYKNIKKLHSDDVLRLKALAPFSEAENKKLMAISSNIEIEEDFFEKYLESNKTVFYESRIPAHLEEQYNALKSSHLLDDQVNHEGDEDSEDSLEISFNELEERLNDKIIHEKVELASEAESTSMAKCYDSLMHQIKRAEADLFLWQLLVDKVIDRPNPFCEPDTLAVLFSENIEFKMNKKEIVLGRASSSSEVDIDLFAVKPDKRISRKQCVICHIKSNLFYVFNTGKLPLYVDGNPVLTNTRLRINEKSLIEIGDVSLIFLINYNIIAVEDSLP